MKKILSLLLVAAMSLTMLAGCGSTQKSSSADSKSASSDVSKVAEAVSNATGGSAKGKLIGITVPSVGNDFMLALSKAMQAALEKEGCKVQVNSAENNVTTQLSQIENFTSMKCAAIVVWPVNGNGVANACQTAVKAGVPVVAFAYEIPGATTSVISATEQSMSSQCVNMTNDWINKTFLNAGNGQVKVLVITSSTVPESVTRSNGLKEIAKNPKVKMITAEVTDQDNTNAARSLTENTMLTNKDINVIIAMNGTCAIGAESYVDSAKSAIKDKSKFAIFCVDQSDQITAKIKASTDNTSVLRGTVSMGSMDDTVNDFMKGMTPIITGKTPISRVDGKAFVITPDTLAAKK